MRLKSAKSFKCCQCDTPNHRASPRGELPKPNSLAGADNHGCHQIFAMMTPVLSAYPLWCEVKTTVFFYFGAEPDRSIPILLPGVGMDASPDCSRDGVPATPLSVAAAAPPVVGELLSFAALTAPPVAAGGGVAPAEPAQQSRRNQDRCSQDRIHVFFSFMRRSCRR